MTRGRKPTPTGLKLIKGKARLSETSAVRVSETPKTWAEYRP